MNISFFYIAHLFLFVGFASSNDKNTIASDQSMLTSRLIKETKMDSTVSQIGKKDSRQRLKKRYIDPYTITLMNLYSVYG
ncbi:hypothetical protein BpHYR1_026767 [Brachionus plicatilis]|uniref:Uncharacterized protein n=1 Tax=Brachionus plicatilis TaxID=10195 RepID=A0A3M7QXW1_BRAPC|nr:hypothetical protein BpHYR1_026767 [Brachionus plicatilis]